MCLPLGVVSPMNLVLHDSDGSNRGSSRVAANQRLPVTDVALLRPAVVYDLHVEGWYVLAAEILSYANRPVRVEVMIIHACRARLKSFCSSEKCGESFFCSSVRYVIGWLWARIYYALKRSGVAPPC